MKLICYGSLMDQRSMEQTLGRRAVPRRVDVPGYRKVFNAPFDGYAYLNLAADPAASTEAVFYNVRGEEMAAFAKREAGSELVEVMPGFWAFIWPQSSCRNLPAVQSYIRMCEAAANRLNLNFWQWTPAPEQIINDLEQPLYEYFRT